jgi:hypothetical protein
MSKPTHLDLLAYHLYQTSPNNKSGGAFVRWWCMDEALKKEYRTKATDLYEKWSAEEQRTQKESDDIEAKAMANT